MQKGVRLHKGVKVQEFSRRSEPARRSVQPRAANVDPRPLDTTRRPFTGALPSPVDTRLQKTVEELQRSIRKLKQSLAEKRPVPTQPNATTNEPALRRIQINELAHYPGLSAQRLVRRPDGRLIRAPWPKPANPGIAGETVDASREKLASMSIPIPTQVSSTAQPAAALGHAALDQAALKTHPKAKPAANDSQTRVENWADGSWIAALAQETNEQQPSGASREGTGQSGTTENGSDTSQIKPIRLNRAADGPVESGGDGAEPLSEIADGKPIDRIGASLSSDQGELPPDYATMRFAQAGEVVHGTGASRNWGDSAFRWEAAAMHHQPLYFEDINLERHGYSTGMLQPVVSAAHFFGRVPVLPYLIGARPHRECTYTLGHYRPGSCAPFERHWPRPSLRGGLYQAGTVTGMIFVFP